MSNRTNTLDLGLFLKGSSKAPLVGRQLLMFAIYAAEKPEKGMEAEGKPRRA